MSELLPIMFRPRWAVLQQWGLQLTLTVEDWLWLDERRPAIELALQLLMLFLLLMLLGTLADALLQWATRKAPQARMLPGEAYELIVVSGPAAVASLAEWYVEMLGYEVLAAAAPAEEPAPASAGGAEPADAGATRPRRRGKRRSSGEHRAAPTAPRKGGGTAATMLRRGQHALLLQDAGALLAETPELAIALQELPQRGRYHFVGDINAAAECLHTPQRTVVLCSPRATSAGIWEMWYTDPSGTLCAFAQAP
eukprot:TRINITY_DN65093_c0_g1_i1.p1 TRINITY_DN65093_c0_g1~~TRINITY_DN65093_c0_g1_i1.p1  ORF type:complete len:277 (+),score=77.16 TRINITY_DN65093_c0_g1_i1:75-833(+)